MHGSQCHRHGIKCRDRAAGIAAGHDRCHVTSHRATCKLQQAVTARTSATAATAANKSATAACSDRLAGLFPPCADLRVTKEAGKQQRQQLQQSAASARWTHVSSSAAGGNTCNRDGFIMRADQRHSCNWSSRYRCNGFGAGICCCCWASTRSATATMQARPLWVVCRSGMRCAPSFGLYCCGLLLLAVWLPCRQRRRLSANPYTNHGGLCCRSTSHWRANHIKLERSS